MKRYQKAGFLIPRSSKIIVTEETERRKDEEKERRKKEKCNGYNTATLETDFWPKNLPDPKAPLGDNVIKNAARPVKKRKLSYMQLYDPCRLDYLKLRL